MKRYVLLICIALFTACAGAYRDAHKPGCMPVDLAAIEAEYVTEATAACKAEGAHSTAECKAFPAIRDKYRAKRAAYVECKP